MKQLLTILLCLLGLTSTTLAQQRMRGEHFQTDTPMVHDPVMAKEGDTYYLFSTGMGIQRMTSKDRRTWTMSRQPVMTVIPGWTTDSVPGFGNHVWAPDVIRWHNRWWLAYSCSTFGKNGSAIGLLSSRSLAANLWKDEGCIVTSRSKRDNWNAIDPSIVIDDATDTPWLVWGSFWDGIQLARLDTTMHLDNGKWPRTIARRYHPDYKPTEPNPTSRYAGTNAIEAPFIFKHGGYYYLFVSWDYCCRGPKSNYRVAVGRSQTIEGPYLDRNGKDMAEGGGTLFLEGDKKQWEAAGHCAAYTFDGEDIFICHGYSATMNGAALLIQRPISWTADGWPELQSSEEERRRFGNLRRYAEDNARVRQLPQEQRRVVFIGNSITDSWINIRPDFFSQNGYIDRGISGQTSYQFVVRYRADVIELKPQIVVINTATNDIAENTCPYNEDRTFANIESMVEQALANDIKVILTTTLPAARFGWNPAIKDAPAKIESLNARIRDYAARKQLTFVDYYSHMVTGEDRALNPAYTNDGVHPTAAGYAVMEALIKTAIDKLLAE